jgi:hypothetical protein
MAEITVSFQVPAWIEKGLANGTLERVGGVIRDASGSKKVRAWLREGSSVRLDNPSDVLMEQISKLSMPSNMLIGLQAMNLAVSAAGFTLLYKKLQGIEHRLTAISDQLSRLESGLEWLSHKEMLKQFTRISSALRSLNDSESYQNKILAEQLLARAVSDLQECQIYFHQVLHEMFGREWELYRPEETGACYRTWLMAGTGKIQTLLAMKEPDVANKTIIRFRSEHAELGRRLEAIISDPLRQFALPETPGKEAVLAIRQLGREAVHAHEIIRGNALQLEWTANQKNPLPNVDPDELRNHPAFAIYSVSPLN